MDFVLSLITIILLSPVFLIIAVLVRIKLGNPVIFKQKRPGLNEKIFTLYKFRTMIDERDETGELLPDGERLTEFGKWLRSTSLDELPELFNILKGDIEYCGAEASAYTISSLANEQQRRRHEVRPGLTGLAQVNGRNAISWEQKFKLDVEYINNIHFIGDWRIILLTVKNVLKEKELTQKLLQLWNSLKVAR